MKKPHDYKRASLRKCRVCKKPIKLNLTERQPNADLCFKHYQQIVRRNPRFNTFWEAQHG